MAPNESRFDFRIRALMRSIYYSIRPFSSSEHYWGEWYEKGGNSGPGSYNQLAQFKASVINRFVAKESINSVIEFGCGDGNQLTLANYPRYIGYDISQRAVDMCKRKFRTDHLKSFKIVEDYSGEKAQLTLSLDVIYHLVEDHVFEQYMERLFKASTNYVIIYSSNYESNKYDTSPHVRHRNFSVWVKSEKPQWRLKCLVPNEYPYTGDPTTGSSSDFYIYSLS